MSEEERTREDARVVEITEESETPLVPVDLHNNNNNNNNNNNKQTLDINAKEEEKLEGKGEGEGEGENKYKPPVYEKYGILYESYSSEHQLEEIKVLMEVDLSEPYSIFTYRYFVNSSPNLCWIAREKKEEGEGRGKAIGAIVCKLSMHKGANRGYIAMLAVDHSFRHRKIGSELVRRAIQEMEREKGDEVVLETEITNGAALRLYQNFGFLKDKRLKKYYLNGQDAFRLKMILKTPDNSAFHE